MDQVVCIDYYTGKDLDNIRCFFLKFGSFISFINLDYVCVAALSVIICISIFGKIKDNYRWYIFNQCLWELLTIYDCWCTKEIAFTHKYGSSRCFYLYKKSWFDIFFNNVISTNGYTGILLLALTRFFCLYFPNFYYKLTKTNTKLFILIFTYNVVLLIPNIQIFTDLRTARFNVLVNQCKLEVNATCTKLDKFYSDAWFKFYDILSLIFWFFMQFVPLICLFLSALSAFSIIIIVFKQFKFQFQHNKKDFLKSFRIKAVIIAQTVLNVIFLLLESIPNSIRFISSAAKINLNNYITLPEWLDDFTGLSSPFILLSLKKVRIFIECLIILFFMTGYRETAIYILKWIYSHARKRYQKLKITTTSVVITLY